VHHPSIHVGAVVGASWITVAPIRYHMNPKRKGKKKKKEREKEDGCFDK